MGMGFDTSPKVGGIILFQNWNAYVYPVNPTHAHFILTFNIQNNERLRAWDRRQFQIETMLSLSCSAALRWSAFLQFCEREFLGKTGKTLFSRMECKAFLKYKKEFPMFSLFVDMPPPILWLIDS